MKFTHLYEELKLLDICKPVSPEEAEKRDIEGSVIKLKERLDKVNKTKLPDGTWHIHGDLDVSYMNLSTLENLNVSIVDGSFDCSNNKFTSLEGCPKEVNGSFYCYNNKLTSLEGCPNIINGDFACDYNNLTSLKGCPKAVGFSFYCINNQLTSLEGCPTKVDGDFFCAFNQLTSLKGCPTKVDNFCCHNNAKQFTDKEVRTICNVKRAIIN